MRPMMKSYIGRHRVLTDDDLAELALGTPLELWLGEEDETEEEQAAREDAARDILADDPALYRHALAALATAPTPLRRRAARTLHLPDVAEVAA